MKITTIDADLSKKLSQKACSNKRKRTNFNLHQLPDPAQRLLNARASVVKQEKLRRKQEKMNVKLFTSEGWAKCPGCGLVIEKSEGYVRIYFLFSPPPHF